MQTDILITNVTLPASAGRGGEAGRSFISITGDRISATGPMEELDSSAGPEVIDAPGCLVMPGLVNGHCHAAMTLFRGMADDLELMTWLNEHIFPAEAAKVNPEMVYWCSKLAAAEMLLSGTTLVADAYFHEAEAARAFSESGLRCVASHGVIDFPAPGVPDPKKNVEAAGQFVARWQGRDPLVQPAVFAHSPYTCSPETLVRAKEMAALHGVPLYIHLAETRNEQQLIGEPQGATPVKHLDNLGILDEQTICVHCVWVDREDLAVLAERGSGVVLCPQSHLKLASGIAPLSDMLAAGIRVGLGTDGAASNNGLDMFREMDVCAKVQKVRTMDPVGVPAASILSLATGSGAGLLGMEEGWGSLHPGSQADLLVIDLERPHLQPFYGPDLLVYAGQGSDVSSVIVAGKVVVREGQLQTMDLAETMERVRALAAGQS